MRARASFLRTALICLHCFCCSCSAAVYPGLSSTLAPDASSNHCECWYGGLFRRYQDSGRAMGYAHIDFTTTEAAAAAVALDGKYMLGRFLNVEYAKAKRSQKGACLLPSLSDADSIRVHLLFLLS